MCWTFIPWRNDRIERYFLLTMMTVPLATLMLALTTLLFSQSALAGSMSFGLSVTGSELTLTNQGSGSAFYPAVFRMIPDGSWARLEASSDPAELAAGAHLQLTWPDTRPEEQMSELERMQPVMVRSFDQSGVGLGQTAFLSAPAQYVGITAGASPPDVLGTEVVTQLNKRGVTPADEVTGRSERVVFSLPQELRKAV